MPKVSVVIPAYNAMKYLPETVASVMNQTYKDFEIILVDDGSSDHIRAWVAEQNIPQIKLISQENRGLSGARNTGIRHAQGEYIAILDADDLWDPTKLQKQVQALEDFSEVSFVYTWTALINERGTLTGRYYKRHEEGDVWDTLIEFNLVGCGSVPLIRKSCFDAAGEFDENLKSFVEDWDLWLRMARLYRFKVIKEPLVYYRQRPDSASKNWAAMERSYQIVIQKNFDCRLPELAASKARCEAFVYLNLAWMALQGANADPYAARQYQRKAVQFFPKIVLRWEFWRFCIASVLSSTLGGEGYREIRAVLSTVRNRFSLRRS
jgi:glycosyltransferase involved in cell wall biosynthesis